MKLRRIEGLQVPLENIREDLATAVLVLGCDEPWEAVGLGNEELFELSIGERVLRRDMVEEGVPAYSANSRQPFGMVDRSNLKSFDRPSLLWGIDGTFDWNFVPAGVEFATTDHCGRLQVIHPELDAKYVYHHLRSTRFSYGFDRVFRASLTNIRANVVVEVPIRKDGSFDLERQQSIARSYERANRARDITVESLDLVLETRLGLSAAVRN